MYEWKLGGQYFVLDGGDGQPPVPPGKYIIRVTVNPGFVPAKNEPCRFADPLRPGISHQLPESDFENNVSQITVTIPEHPGRQASARSRISPPSLPSRLINDRLAPRSRKRAPFFSRRRKARVSVSTNSPPPAHAHRLRPTPRADVGVRLLSPQRSDKFAAHPERDAASLLHSEAKSGSLFLGAIQSL